MCDDCCTHEITVALDTWIRPAQDWAHQHFIMDEEKLMKSHPFQRLFSPVCCGMVLLYAVNACCSHLLITKLFWPMAGQDKVRRNNQTEDSEEEGRSGGYVSLLPKQQDVLDHRAMSHVVRHRLIQASLLKSRS